MAWRVWRLWPTAEPVRGERYDSDGMNLVPLKVLSGSSAIPVEVLSTHHDLLDVFAALGGITGALAALAALRLAARSAKDASGSLAIMKREAEEASRIREKRAEPALEVLAHPLDASRSTVILTLVFGNKGTRIAEHVGLNFAVPDTLKILPCSPDGTPEDFGKVVATPKRLSQEGGTMWTCDEIGPVRLGADVVQHLRLDGTSVAKYDLTARVTYDDAVDSIKLKWCLHVPGRPHKITVEPPATWAVETDSDPKQQ
jgi:hypothetical protein